MSDYPLIADHGLIGDLQTSALVATDGSIDWFCAPRFDSPSIFGALLDQHHGPLDVAKVEPHRIRRVDDAGDMDHGLRTVDQPGQRLTIVQVAADPFDTRRLRLLAPGQRPQRDTLPRSLFSPGATDETCGAGNGDRHSNTSWSR